MKRSITRPWRGDLPLFSIIFLETITGYGVLQPYFAAKSNSWRYDGSGYSISWSCQATYQHSKPSWVQVQVCELIWFTNTKLLWTWTALTSKDRHRRRRNTVKAFIHSGNGREMSRYHLSIHLEFPQRLLPLQSVLVQGQSVQSNLRQDT